MACIMQFIKHVFPKFTNPRKPGMARTQQMYEVPKISQLQLTTNLSSFFYSYGAVTFTVVTHFHESTIMILLEIPIILILKLPRILLLEKRTIRVGSSWQISTTAAPGYQILRVLKFSDRRQPFSASLRASSISRSYTKSLH